MVGCHTGIFHSVKSGKAFHRIFSGFQHPFRTWEWCPKHHPTQRLRTASVPHRLHPHFLSAAPTFSCRESVRSRAFCRASTPKKAALAWRFSPLPYLAAVPAVSDSDPSPPLCVGFALISFFYKHIYHFTIGCQD